MARAVKYHTALWQSNKPSRSNQNTLFIAHFPGCPFHHSLVFIGTLHTVHTSLSYHQRRWLGAILDSVLLFLQLHSQLDSRVPSAKCQVPHPPLTTPPPCWLCLFNELLFSRSAGIEFHNNNNKIRAGITSAIVPLKLMIRTKFVQTNQRLKLDFQQANAIDYFN